MSYSSPRTPRPRDGTPGDGTPGKITRIVIELLPELREIKIPDNTSKVTLPSLIKRVTSSTGENSCIYESDICSTTGSTSKQYISKVVTEEEAKKIIRSNDIIQTIPNYDDYFLLPEFSCKLPSKLDDCDLSEPLYVFRIEQARPIDNADFKTELKDKIKKNSESDTFIKLNSEVQAALKQLHNKGLLHGDITKAKNIVYHNDKFKLIDFSEIEIIEIYKEDKAANELSLLEKQLKTDFGIKTAVDGKRGRSPSYF